MSERATILIVDDEAGLREVLEEYLNAQGYTVLAAENAPAALWQHRGSEPTLRNETDVTRPAVDHPRFHPVEHG